MGQRRTVRFRCQTKRSLIDQGGLRSISSSSGRFIHSSVTMIEWRSLVVAQNPGSTADAACTCLRNIVHHFFINVSNQRRRYGAQFNPTSSSSRYYPRYQVMIAGRHPHTKQCLNGASNTRDATTDKYQGRVRRQRKPERETSYQRQRRHGELFDGGRPRAMTEAAEWCNIASQPRRNRPCDSS